ncbi:MAG: hypothetical protein OXE98_04600 [Hyphomicrobiales bacterium]|nr:hypothetical protein [Hyphomicrobiales bacterium]MCY4053144.1 hypothetical protein [Hyphomicrobiales bacterium]
MKMASEQKNPVLDVGFGGTYSWSDDFAFSAGVSTQQGSEIKGYAANFGINCAF